MAPRPGLDEVRAWLDIAAVDLPDDQLARIYESESMIQAQFCDVPADWHTWDFPAPLAQALLRRCARVAAARGLPLGSLPAQMAGDGAQYGAQLLPRFDAEIERYEAAYKIVGLA